MANTLNVKKVTQLDVEVNWEMPCLFRGDLYARCNPKGIINWETTLVYQAKELVGRNKVKIH